MRKGEKQKVRGLEVGKVRRWDWNWEGGRVKKQKLRGAEGEKVGR